RVIDYQTEYAQSLIDDFSTPERSPHIAISVDMLDTGIDVPEVLNLVFFKIVRSKTKFWQMIGRGTRLSPDLFGPGDDKREFLIFDFCQNFEFFNQNPNVTEGVVAPSLSQRLFATRVEISAAIQGLSAEQRDDRLGALEADHRARLRDEVAGMTIDNFLVRAKRRVVEAFQHPDAWDNLSAEDREILINDVAGLPTALVDDDIAAKQFDLIVLRGQLSILNSDPAIARCQEKVSAIAARLEALGNVPIVAAMMPVILEVQTPEFWQDIDAWSLEQMRRQLRGLIKLIEGEARVLVYTDFTDEIGESSTITLPMASVGTDKERFQMKAQNFLRRRLDHITIQKLRRNEQLTPQDLDELERILVEEIGATNTDLDEARAAGGFGLFVRSLVGLERDAAKLAFAGFLAERNLNANQIEFINLIIEYLTERGAMDPRRLYESPFTDFNDQGISGVFPQLDVQQLMKLINEVRQRAAA
ncbi:MAG: restriction endonuclease subunit R, partial [Alphaproteobacteria bacterium]|nr:restriction endonuclease subunit R [Alphaproteobacteria bacterium]